MAKNCLQCGNVLPPERRGGRTYCDKYCCSRAHNKRRQAASFAKRGVADVGSCKYCRKSFERTKGDQLYCPGGVCRKKIYIERRSNAKILYKNN